MEQLEPDDARSLPLVPAGVPFRSQRSPADGDARLQGVLQHDQARDRGGRFITDVCDLHISD